MAGGPALLYVLIPEHVHLLVSGPEKFRLDELVRQYLEANNDPREVVADPKARYYCIEVSEKTLVPDDGARLSETRFETWLKQAVGQMQGLPEKRSHSAA
jgi:hypothetical protein